MKEQIFGFTEPKMADVGEFVRFAQAFNSDTGIVLAVRNSRGEISEVAIPKNAAARLGVALIRGAADGAGAALSDDQIKHMVDRFLMWTLPSGFHPDNGISFVPPSHPNHLWPVGTNLFDAKQADAMVRHMLAGLPPA